MNLFGFPRCLSLMWWCQTVCYCRQLPLRNRSGTHLQPWQLRGLGNTQVCQLKIKICRESTWGLACVTVLQDYYYQRPFFKDPKEKSYDISKIVIFQGVFGLWLLYLSLGNPHVRWPRTRYVVLTHEHHGYGALASCWLHKPITFDLFSFSVLISLRSGLISGSCSSP
jgi:hypothetical protein